MPSANSVWERLRFNQMCWKKYVLGKITASSNVGIATYPFHFLPMSETNRQNLDQINDFITSSNSQSLTFACSCSNRTLSGKNLGWAGKVLNPSPGWWLDTLLFLTASSLNTWVCSGTREAGSIQIYVQTLKTFFLGMVLQWKVLLSKRMKSPAWELTLMQFFKGSFSLSSSGIKNQFFL